MELITNPVYAVEIIISGKTTLNNLIKMQANKEFQELFYCDGVIFSFEYAEERFDEGTLFLDSFYYTDSEKVDSVKFRGFEIDVIDYTGIEVFVNIVKELKKWHKKLHIIRILH